MSPVMRRSATMPSSTGKRTLKENRTPTKSKKLKKEGASPLLNRSETFKSYVPTETPSQRLGLSPPFRRVAYAYTLSPVPDSEDERQDEAASGVDQLGGDH
ncbi:hypothetical protein VNI00_002310 [Paramarasmius palmivorus]|uniref:Uncharacterized protein n=1 Tax=Paramarasmius palmivorus TaxID=297713 RepID=A0AAW0E3V3_9AGAR